MPAITPRPGRDRIQIAKADDAVGFSIENTGVHIPEEEIPGLFEPFTRGEPSRKQGDRRKAVWGLFYCADGAGAASFFLPGWKNTDDGVRFSIIFAVP